MEVTSKKTLSTPAKGKDSSPSFEREDVQNSPFTIISLPNGEVFGVMGDFRITENLGSKAAVRKELAEITWNRITQVCWIINQQMFNLNNNKK